jgi:hypothetical protein
MLMLGWCVRALAENSWGAGKTVSRVGRLVLVFAFFAPILSLHLFDFLCA